MNSSFVSNESEGKFKEIRTVSGIYKITLTSVSEFVAIVPSNNRQDESRHTGVPKLQKVETVHGEVKRSVSSVAATFFAEFKTAAVMSATSALGKAEDVIPEFPTANSFA